MISLMLSMILMTLCKDKKSKRIRFENVEKNQMEFKSSLRSIKIGGNLSTAEKRVLNYIMDILK